jgi:patatin-related protein
MNSLNSPIPETGQEVRFAVAMSGGVSLAVWMGGVAREMNLLQEASNLRQSGYLPVSTNGSGSSSAGAGADIRRAGDGRPGAGGPGKWDDRCRGLYLGLLELLNVTVTVDVLSGTSGGGINAALLGLSSAAGVDLGGLRDLWLSTGSMDKLLRGPWEIAPPSLMQGDKVLFAELDSGIKNLYHRTPKYTFPGADSSAAAPGTSVFITTTMMSGETGRFTDDFGTLVPDVDHHGLFTFDEQALGAGGAPKLTELALAARCSASFPGAFEPSFVPINARIAAYAGVPERPDMAAFANMTRSHWVADGGLLANRPLTPLLAKVFSQPATGQVRRVLAFVVPDGGGTSHATQAVAGDDWRYPPTMADALKEDLDAQESQSIASDLQAARTHNERIEARHGLRRRLADLGSRLAREDQQPAGSPPADGLVDGRLLDEFERQQGSGMAQSLLTEVMRELTTMQIPDAWAAEFAPGQQAETRMAGAMVQVLGRGWRESQPAQPPGGDPAAPAAGAPSPDGEEAAAWAAWTAATDPYARATMFGLPVFRAARALVIHLIRRGYQRATDSGLRTQLARHRAAIKDLSELLPPGWTDEHGKVRAYLEQVLARGPAGDLEAVAADLAEQKRQALQIGEGAAALNTAWKQLAIVMQSLLADLLPLSAPDGRPARADAAKAIGGYQRYFGQAPEPARLADRLLKLALAERALLPADTDLDQPVELVQFSANTRTLLAPAHESAPAPQQLDSVTKLRGVELHHFAAFYKSSWRAWDWMWGRLDGSGWLVHILLDPRRILAVAEDDPQAFPEGQRAASFADALRAATGLQVGLPGDCLEQDLAFLDDHNAEVPVSLPNSALFLAQAWQNLITANELPTIAEQMLAYGPPDPWAGKVLSMIPQAAASEEFARQLPECPIRRETLAGEELRTPLFNSMTTRSISVAMRTVRLPEYLTGPLASMGSGPIAEFTRFKYMGQFASSIAFFRGGRYALPAALATTAAGAIASTSTIVAISAVGLVIELGGLLLVIASAARRISISVAVVALAAGSALIAAGFIPFIHNHLFLWLEKTALPALAKHPALWAIVVTLLLLPSLWTIMEIVRRPAGRRTRFFR